MKCRMSSIAYRFRRSPLAEGRELKFVCLTEDIDVMVSPLAEGRELK